MKRGKDEEKIMGPMFPRLHVNDTEKGGPRAPPRNKMALYEQLSIPSQRFNHGVLPPNPNNTTNLVPPASSSQANGRERSMFVPLQRPPSTNPAEKPYTRYADLNAPLMQLEQQNNREEDDFQVPIFDHNKVNFASNQSPRENIEGPLKQSNAPSSYGVANESTRSLDYRNSSVPIRNLQEEEQRNLTDNNGDDLSETSMVDSISAVDISPDDVVGIIGQKHFWKARRAIVNQQRVFAVQVFELHRLMKVQRLIAASPHLLLEDNAYLGKPPKASPAKKLPLEYIVKATPNIEKPKLVSEKSNRTSECSAENAVAEKASLSSVQNGSKHPNYSDPSPTGVTSDTKMGSWGFNQPPGHQWLIPVMTPSEGLVYKPYPGPGFSGPACGGCGPPGSTPPPTMGNFLYYGLPPPPHHYQGLGVPHFAPPGSHGYFPPYGMPVMNPSDLVPSGPDFNMQYQSSCNAPTQKNGADSGAMNTHTSKDGELQASTASSPSVRGQRTRVGPTAEDKNPLSLFPTGPVPDGVPPPHDTDLPTRVIRVVPHNARSATESAARIFQSIQEERKQYDSG